MAEPPSDRTPSAAESVVGSLPTFEWDSRESVQYEVAVEALSQLVAACSERIYELDKAGEGNFARLAELVAAQKGFVDRRKALRATDHAAVQEIIRTAKDVEQQILAEK